jgi:dTDP-4-amino-4,6-dideoxygalactose transaminase
MKIPMLDLKAQYKSIQKEVDGKIAKVLENQMFILGEEVSSLEKEIAEYTGAKYAVGVSSGSDALIISLIALGIENGDAVITTPFTFFATAGAISRLGAVPVFCDIDEVTYNLNPRKLEICLESQKNSQNKLNIRAILPVHLYGQCADMDPIMAIADKHQVPVIEDAAQAIGSEYPGKKESLKAGNFGKTGTLSFFPSKNLGGIGDGGMVLTNDEDLAVKLRKLRVHGSRDKYYYDILGGNFRLDAIQAAVLRVKLKHLDDWQEKRRERAGLYEELFHDLGLINQEHVEIPAAVYKESGIKNYHTYHQYVIRAENRDELQSHLKKKGIPSAIFYPLSLHLQKCFASLGYKHGDFPVSEKATSEVLALPIYPELTREQQEHIVRTIASFYKEK